MLPELTDHKNQVLKLIADGLTNREISGSLTISKSTVENHIHHIYEKLGISNRAQAVTDFFRLITISQNDTKIKGILYDRIRDNYPNVYGITSFIKCHKFDKFTWSAVMKLTQLLRHGELICHTI